MKNKYTKILVLILIALVLEVIVFNITSYRILFGGFEKKVFTNFKVESQTNTRVILLIDEIDAKVGTVKVNFSNIYDVSEYKLFYSDKASDSFLDLPSKFYVPNNAKSQYLPVFLSGNTKALKIEIDKSLLENGNFEGIAVNEKIPFEFNIVRFIVVFGIISLVYFWKNGKVFNENYSPEKNIKQEVILILVMGIFFFLTAYLNANSFSERRVGNENILTKILGITVEGDIYNKDFVESIKKGQFYLEKKPSDELLKLENPYDNVTRDNKVERNIDYLWDTALYNGRLYVYFGILPLLLTFLPFNLLFHKYLSISFVVLIFSIMVLILLKAILSKIVDRYFSDIKFKNMFLFLIILYSGSLVLYANGISRIYELVIVAGMYFVLQGLFFYQKSQEKEEKKYLYIFLGSLFLALSVACRPTDLFASLIVLPYLIYLLIKNIKEDKKTLIKLIFSVRYTIFKYSE